MFRLGFDWQAKKKNFLVSFTTFAVGGLLKHESPGPHVISELKLKRETPKGRTRVGRESLRFEVCDLLKIEIQPDNQIDDASREGLE